MSKTSIRPISIPQNPARMSRARSRTTTQATALGSPFAMPSSLPSDSTSSPGKPHSKPSAKPSSRPSSLSSSSRATTESNASRAIPSLDINIRDFFPDGDASVLKYVDEASIVREQAKALQSYRDETLARALQISQETALTEAEARIKSKGKTKEPTSKLDDRAKTSSSLPSRKDVYVLGHTSALVPASDNVTKEGRVRREEEAGQPSPRELLLSSSSPTMTVPPLPMERYSPDEVAARVLAEDWRVSSLQDALLAHPDIMHPPVPISASPSTSSSSSSASSSLFSPASTTSTALSSPISSPISSLPSSSSSSASAAARKGDASPTSAIPMIIPAEAFYSRSSHTRQSSSSTRSSVTSLRNSPPQTSLTTSPAKDKPLPLHPGSAYTSASSAAAARVAANSSSSKITTVSSSTSHSEQNHISPTRASFPSSVSSSRSVSSSSSTSSALASSRARGNSKNTPSAESKPSAQKSAQSPERATHISASSNSSYNNVTTSATSGSMPGLGRVDELSLNSSKTYVRASYSAKSLFTASTAAAPQDTSPRVERVPEKPSPRSSLRSSQIVPQWSLQEANHIKISASVVAAEREKARMSTSTSSASAAAAASKHSTAAKPLRDLNQRDLSSSNAGSSSSLVSALQTARVPEPHTHPRDVLAKPPHPRNAEELFSAPRVKGMERSMVVPISSLSESDDEDDDIYDDDTGEEKGVRLVDEKHNTEVGVENVDMKPVPFVDIYTANRCCSKCGESIPSTPNTLLILTAPTLHVSCPKCSTLHCRGCSRPANCPKNCSGSKSCVINNCCPQVRAIAIFEALSIFDRDYLLEAGLNSGNKDRDEFVKALISKPLTLQSRKVESILIKAMTVITEIFKTCDCQPFPPSSPSLISLCFEVVEFFEHSLMPEVIRAFLDSTNVKDWITHSGTYAVMLDLLRYMLEGGSTSICGVMDVQLRKIEKSCGLGEWMLGRGEIDWAAEGEVAKERKRQEDRDDKQKKGEMSRGQLRGGEEKYNASVSFHANTTLRADERKPDVVFATPLKDLIPALEKFRKSLWELSARMAFPSTVEKLNMLCDRISQLALSQVIGV